MAKASAVSEVGLLIAELIDEVQGLRADLAAKDQPSGELREPARPKAAAKPKVPVKPKPKTAARK